MKTQRFSYFADFAARERMREAKPVKLKKVAFSHFFDTLKPGNIPGFSLSKNYPNAPVSAIIEETGVFTWKVGEKTHGMSQSS